MLFTIICMVSIGAQASEVKQLAIQCSQIIDLVNDINERIPDNKRIQVEECEETHETALFGMVKKNFQANVKLSTQDGLCTESEFIEQEILLGDGVHLGIDYQRKLKVLEAYGIVPGRVKAYGGLHGHYLTGIHFPVCN
jgi:hypothetical protein